MKPSTRFPGFTLFVLSALLVFGSAARAQTQITTLTKPEITVAGLGPNPGSDYWLGQAFTTDAGSYMLNFISAPMAYQTAGTMRAQLFLGDGSGLPTGPALANFTYDAISSAFPTTGTVTFTPTATFIFSASTQYVFVMNPNSAGYWGWSSTLAGNGYDTPAGHAWLLNTGYAGSLDHGATWSLPNTGLNMRLAVATTAVPEPAADAAIFGAAALAGVGLVRRRRT